MCEVSIGLSTLTKFDYMSPLINKILSADQQSVEQSLKTGMGIYTFLNPVSYLDALKHKELFSSFDGIYADGVLLAKAIKMLYGKSVKRRSFDMTSLAPVVFSFAAKNQKTVAIVATKQEMVEKAVKTLQGNYPGLNFQSQKESGQESGSVRPVALKLM